MPTSHSPYNEQGQTPRADGAAPAPAPSKQASWSSTFPDPYDVTMDFKPINDPAACRPWLYDPYDVTKNFTPINKPKVSVERSSSRENNGNTPTDDSNRSEEKPVTPLDLEGTHGTEPNVQDGPKVSDQERSRT